MAPDPGSTCEDRDGRVKILSHRGYWTAPPERNTRAAFERSFAAGLGTELDLRDLGGELVIAHDPPAAGALAAERVFELLARHDPALPLAVNIKADGLQAPLAALIARTGLRDAFVFDMSVPDTLQWQRTQVPVFVRHSDVEPDPVLYEGAAGVWLDGFGGDWWDTDVVRRHLAAGKRVCVVSPELHGRDPRPVWERLAAGDFAAGAALMLCTDHPGEARERFGHDH